MIVVGQFESFLYVGVAFGVWPFEESRCSANLHRKNKILFTSTNHSILDAHLWLCCVHDRSSVNGSNNHFIPSDDNEETLIPRESRQLMFFDRLKILPCEAESWLFELF